MKSSGNIERNFTLLFTILTFLDHITTIIIILDKGRKQSMGVAFIQFISWNEDLVAWW